MKEHNITPWAYDTELYQKHEDLDQISIHSVVVPQSSSFNYHSLSNSGVMAENDYFTKRQRPRLVKTASTIIHRRHMTSNKNNHAQKILQNNFISNCLKLQKDKLQRQQYQSLSTTIIKPKISISHKNLQFSKVRQKQIKNTNIKILKSTSSSNQKNRNQKNEKIRAAKILFFDSEEIFLNQKMHNLFTSCQQRSKKGLQMRINGILNNVDKIHERGKDVAIKNKLFNW